LRYRSQLALPLALLLAGSMWFYFEHILIPYQKADALAHQRPRGNLSDLYPRWLGARELLLHHRDPYSQEITREIQVNYYGRVLDPARPSDPKDEQRFAYPVYVVFLLAPTVRLPFPVVQKGFYWLLGLLTVGSVWLWLRALRWQASLLTSAIFAVMTMGAIAVVQGIKLQQLTMLVSGGMAAAAAALASGWLVLAGTLLALTTVKPQLALPLAGWLIVWSISNWSQRKRLVLSFGITMAVLMIGAEVILPGWIPRFWAAVHEYRRYTAAESFLGMLLTPTLGRIVDLAIVMLIVAICWRSRRSSASDPAFAGVLCMVLAATVVVVPTIALYNQVLLLPGVMLLIHERVWASPKTSVRFTASVAAIFLFWPWLTSIALCVATRFVPLATVESSWKTPFLPVLALPLVTLLLLVSRVLNLQEKQQSPAILHVK
jgi:Glycosyltransferase family 87